jgi:hypothetical protein
VTSVAKAKGDMAEREVAAIVSDLFVPLVLGLDLSLTNTGVAHINGVTESLRAPERKRSKGERRTLDDDMARLGWLLDQITPFTSRIFDPASGRPLVEVPVPHLVVIEDYAFSRGDSHSHALGELGGIVRLDLWERGIPFVLVGPSSLKTYATGRGNAKKNDVRMERFKRTGVDERDDNQNDAWWLRAMALDALGCPVLQLPTTHRRALDGVDWRGHRTPIEAAS